MSAPEVAEQIGAFSRALRLDDVPLHVRRQLARLLLDHAAVCEAGRHAPAARIAADHATEAHGGDSATALLDGRRLSAPGAAWANGVLANALDYDDGHRLTKGHPGAIVIPAALAIAEAVDATVDELFEAILVGYEVAVRAGSCSTRASSSTTRPPPGVVSELRPPRAGCSASRRRLCVTPWVSPSTTRRSR